MRQQLPHLQPSPQSLQPPQTHWRSRRWSPWGGRTGGRCAACTELSSLAHWGTWKRGEGAGSEAGAPRSTLRPPPQGPPAHRVRHFWHISQGWSGEQKVPFLQAHCVFLVALQGLSSTWSVGENPTGSTLLLGLSAPFPNPAKHAQTRGRPGWKTRHCFTHPHPTPRRAQKQRFKSPASSLRVLPRAQILMVLASQPCTEGMLPQTEPQGWHEPPHQLGMQPAPAAPAARCRGCALHVESSVLSQSHALDLHRPPAHQLLPSLHVQQRRHLSKRLGYSMYPSSSHGKHVLEPFCSLQCSAT